MLTLVILFVAVEHQATHFYTLSRLRIRRSIGIGKSTMRAHLKVSGLLSLFIKQRCEHTFGNTIFTIPDLDKRDLIRLLPIKIIPFLFIRVVDRNCLSQQFELFFVDTCGVDFRGLGTAIIHHCEGPVFHCSVNWSPYTSSCQLSLMCGSPEIYT
jgi:hypothetical protein